MHSSDESTIPPRDLEAEQDLTGLPVPPPTEQCTPSAARVREHQQRSDTEAESLEAAPNMDSRHESGDPNPATKPTTECNKSWKAARNISHPLLSRNANETNHTTAAKTATRKIKARSSRDKTAKGRVIATTAVHHEILPVGRSHRTASGFSPESNERMQKSVEGREQDPLMAGTAPGQASQSVHSCTAGKTMSAQNNGHTGVGSSDLYKGTAIPVEDIRREARVPNLAAGRAIGQAGEELQKSTIKAKAYTTKRQHRQNGTEYRRERVSEKEHEIVNVDLDSSQVQNDAMVSHEALEKPQNLGGRSRAAATGKREGRAAGTNAKKKRKKKGLFKSSQKAPNRRNLQAPTAKFSPQSSPKNNTIGWKGRKQKLPSMQAFLEKTCFPAHARLHAFQDACKLEEAYSVSHVASPLPPIKELVDCRQKIGSFQVLKAAGSTSRHREQPSFEALFNVTQTNPKSLLKMKTDTHSQSEKMQPSTTEDWMKRNDKLNKEVLNLRAELVLTYNEGPVSLLDIPSVHSNQSIENRELVLSTIHVDTAISLSHAASQLASAGFVQAPRSFLRGPCIPEDSKQYINCARRGFEFIRNQMNSSDYVSERSKNAVSAVFRDVHLKLVEDTTKKSRIDGCSGNSVFTELVSFLLLQIEEVYQSLLAVEAGIDVIWSSTVSETILTCFGLLLNLSSPSSNEQLKMMLVGVLQGIAERIREGENKSDALSIEGLCNAMEVSMTIVMNSHDSALMLPLDDLYVIGRHNMLISEYVFSLDSFQRAHSDQD